MYQRSRFNVLLMGAQRTVSETEQKINTYQLAQLYVLFQCTSKPQVIKVNLVSLTTLQWFRLIKPPNFILKCRSNRCGSFLGFTLKWHNFVVQTRQKFKGGRRVEMIKSCRTRNVAVANVSTRGLRQGCGCLVRRLLITQVCSNARAYLARILLLCCQIRACSRPNFS